MDMAVQEHRLEVAQRISAGNAHAQAHNWKAAATEYRTALAIDEHSAPAANNLGYVLQVNQHSDEAIALYLRALAVDPQLKEARENLLAGVMQRMQQACAEDDLPSARRWVAIGISALGAERELLVARGDLCLAEEKYDEAIASYAAVLQTDRGDAYTWARVGETCDAAGDAKRASGAYLTALQSAGKAARMTDEGVAAMREGDYTRAVRSFRKALHEDADYVPALEYLEWAKAARDADL